MPRFFLTFAFVLIVTAAWGGETQESFVTLRCRASAITPGAREYPEIDFVFDTDNKPADWQHVAIDRAVAPRGQVVIWLMRYNESLARRVTGYGYHFVQPHYANRWFSKVCRENPVGETCRGNVRLEAATGLDLSDQVDIQPPDGMANRAFRLLQWADAEDPSGQWNQFVNEHGVRWDKVVLAGSSHGSTTAARFAKHQQVDRVVMLCGPRDQYQTWQSLPSATPPERFFGFSHTLDSGWVGDHYCRSWELLGLHQFGPIVDVDTVAPPYDNTRRLVTSFDVGGNANVAHSAVTPGHRSKKNDDGSLAHDPVWEYLFTHPVDAVGTPTTMDDACQKDQRN